MPALSLVSLNIEGAKHLDLVIPFLHEKKPDVVCLQELFESDIPKVEEALGRNMHVFSPMLRREKDGVLDSEGVAIFSRIPIERSASHYYHYAIDQSPAYDDSTPETKRATQNQGLILADVRKDDACYRVITTHFTWTPDGAPDEYQRTDMNTVLEILEGSGEFVFCGDFNAPRTYKGAPGEIFLMLSSKYKDTIPAHYRTSIDIERHRAGKTFPEQLADKMVDGLFTTPRYLARDVVLQNGVSDHMAILAKISTAEV